MKYDFSKISLPPTDDDTIISRMKDVRFSVHNGEANKDVRFSVHSHPGKEVVNGGLGENYVKGSQKGYQIELQNSPKIPTAKSTSQPSLSTSNISDSPNPPSKSPKVKRKRVKKADEPDPDQVPIIPSIRDNPFYKAEVEQLDIEEEIPTEETTNLSNRNDLSGYGVDLAAVDKELVRAKAELCKRDFSFFIKEFWDEVVVEKLIWNWHIGYIASQLQPIAYNVANRHRNESDMIINVPPGTSKSTIVSIMFPVYCWLVDPTISFITASHDQELATRQSNASRQLMKCEKFKTYFPHVSFKETQDNKTDYENRNGGYRLATSTKSSPTGRHALIIILDDPQNPDTANSEIERGNTNTWVGSTLSTRKSNKAVAVTITVQQRLHPFDVTGYLLGKEKTYKHICLPAELNKSVQPVDVSGFYMEGLLDPVRLSMEELTKLKVDMGTKAYQTQINQLPNDEENAILKEKWFNIIPKIEWEVLVKDNKPVIDFYLDTAFTKKTNRDPSAILACTKIGNDLYILGVSAVRYEFPKLLTHIKEWTSAQGYTPRSKIIIEPKANGISIVQQLKNDTALNVIQGKTSKDDKKTRLNAISAIVEAGRVFLIDGHWNKTFLGEVTADDPLHDDIRDCFVAAMEAKMTKSKSFGTYHIR